MPNKALIKNNLILLAGQQQNVGKTTLACSVISRFSREYSIYALKVTPHFHENTGNASALIVEENFQILEEKSTDTNKDTSRMLKSGAEKAYLLQTNSKGMLDGLIKLFGIIPESSMIVCESAGVREHIKPGVFLALRQLYCKVCSIEDDNMFSLADRVVTFTVNGFDFSMDELSIKDGKWRIG